MILWSLDQIKGSLEAQGFPLPEWSCGLSPPVRGRPESVVCGQQALGLSPAESCLSALLRSFPFLLLKRQAPVLTRRVRRIVLLRCRAAKPPVLIRLRFMSFFLFSAFAGGILALF